VHLARRAQETVTRVINPQGNRKVQMDGFLVVIRPMWPGNPRVCPYEKRVL
jgi:hypothetical protein